MLLFEYFKKLTFSMAPSYIHKLDIYIKTYLLAKRFFYLQMNKKNVNKKKFSFKVNYSKFLNRLNIYDRYKFEKWEHGIEKVERNVSSHLVCKTFLKVLQYSFKKLSVF